MARDYLTTREQRRVDHIEETRSPAGWGDHVQLVIDREAGDRYENDLHKGWEL